MYQSMFASGCKKGRKDGRKERSKHSTLSGSCYKEGK